VDKSNHKKLSEYRRIMMQREGLSFSDYFDDSVPYEVKPVHNLTPMEEAESDYIGHSDIPAQSKDLFKGLYEDGGDTNKLIKNSEYWLDPKGRFHRAQHGHQQWASDYLWDKLIPYNRDDAYSETPDNSDLVGIYQTMFKNHFIRIVIDDDTLYTNNPVHPPSSKQLKALKDAAIESGLHLYVGNHRVDTYESVLNEGKSLFIEHMMPNDMDVFKTHLAQLFGYLKEELQLKTVPGVKLVSDEKNADKVLGRTAYYNPDEKLVVLYITNRHQKDILRSFAHEIIHHWQHENEKLHEVRDEETGTKDPQYAQNNPWLRQMEKQAYLLGNILFRDWEDQKKAEDRKSGNDGKTKKIKKEQHGKGNVRFDSLTPIMKQKYNSSHAYRKNVEGPQEPDVEDVQKEQTYSLGNEYPPKKMNYKG